MISRYHLPRVRYRVEPGSAFAVTACSISEKLLSYDVINTQAYLSDEAVGILESCGCQLRLVLLETLSEDEFCREIANADAVVAGGEHYTEKIVDVAERLKIIARTGVGVDHVDLNSAAEHGVWVTNTPGATNSAVAEFAIGLMLNCLRHIDRLAVEMKQGKFVRTEGTELGSLTVGVVGAGGIGKEVLRLARAFGAQAVAYDIHPDQKFADQWQVDYLSLDELLQQADIVSIHCGLDESTHGLIGEAQLKLMKPTSLLVNTARAQIVDKTALVASLKEQAIAGAAIDVWETIPCDPDDPLLKMDNVLTTSWSAFYTTQAVNTMCRVAAEEIARVLSGQQPLHAVNSPAAPRSVD